MSVASSVSAPELPGGQRKVKCDRKFPCAHCVRVGAHCMPGNTRAPRPRRRRFPERLLLERLRHYEALLRQNGISYEPLHPANTMCEHSSPGDNNRGSSESLGNSKSLLSGEKTATKSGEAVNLWHAISRVTLDSGDDDPGDSDGGGDDNVRSTSSDDGHHMNEHGAIFRNVWTQRFQTEGDNLDSLQEKDQFSSGSFSTNFQLYSSHPEQAKLFRLWQVYLDNVDPLLKVTHTPTLQSRIIDAANDVTKISPTLEALMFSIYCVSILSLTNDECLTFFQSSRVNLLQSYQSACLQALLNCGAWQSNDRDGLTALYLYLISIRIHTDPRTLSCMLAVAIRIARHMEMHSEASYSELSILEAEMRRRLWWSLVIFDHRISEMSDYKTTALEPIWDCKIPLNVSDFELRSEMTTPPPIHSRPTEAVFVIVRSEIADFVRHSAFHLDFVNPSLKAVAQSKAARAGFSAEDDELMVLERIIEDKYLISCDMEDPLRFMTICTARGFLARNRLLEHYSRYSTLATRPSNGQRGIALSYALSMLDYDTKIRTSPLSRGFIWFSNCYFPALAYLHILNDVRRRPAEKCSKRAWDVMSENYEALTTCSKIYQSDEQGGLFRFFLTFSRLVLQAWEAREASFKEQNRPLEPLPRFVSDLKGRTMQLRSASRSGQSGDEKRDYTSADINSSGNSPTINIPLDLVSQLGTEGVQSYVGLEGPAYYPEVPEQSMKDVEVDQFWIENDWRWIQTQGW